MNENLVWPMSEPSEAGAPICDAYGLNVMAAEAALQQVVGDEWWSTVEVARHTGCDPQPLDWRTLMCISGEFIERFGYEEAQRYVSAVINSRHDEDALLSFAALVENWKLRFGPKGPVAVAALLAAELAITGRGR